MAAENPLHLLDVRDNPEYHVIIANVNRKLLQPEDRYVNGVPYLFASSMRVNANRKKGYVKFMLNVPPGHRGNAVPIIIMDSKGNSHPGMETNESISFYKLRGMVYTLNDSFSKSGGYRRTHRARRTRIRKHKRRTHKN